MGSRYTYIYACKIHIWTNISFEQIYAYKIHIWTNIPFEQIYACKIHIWTNILCANIIWDLNDNRYFYTLKSDVVFRFYAFWHLHIVVSDICVDFMKINSAGQSYPWKKYSKDAVVFAVAKWTNGNN